MKGYWIILGTAVGDEVAQNQYGKLWGPIAEKYRARVNPTTVPPLLKDKRDTAREISMSKPAKTKPAAKQPSRKKKAKRKARADTGGKTKQGTLLALLQQPDGATIAELAAAAGWQQHSVRGFLAGHIRKIGYALISQKRDTGRRYLITGKKG